MTPEDRADVVRRLLAMQHSLRTVIEAAEVQATYCDAAGAKGLAFAVHMLKESLSVYSSELNRWVTAYIEDDDSFAAGIE
jgi:hypothetical protein